MSNHQTSKIGLKYRYRPPQPTTFLQDGESGLPIHPNVLILGMSREEKYMLEAIRLSREGMESLQGGPFGCVIVKGDTIVGRGWNRVLATNDPTAHAEVTAIRDACTMLGTFQLQGCELYTSCEPCPMCLGAIYWARPDRIYYANTRHDAAGIGFDDSMIYDELVLPLHARKIEMSCIAREEAIRVFKEWVDKGDKTLY